VSMRPLLERPLAELPSVRWILLIPAMIAAWFAVAFAGLLLYGHIEYALCPRDQWISNTCFDPDVDRIMRGVINAFIGLSALAVGGTGVLVAPAYRRCVAWVIFVAGACLSIAFGFVQSHDLGDGAATSDWDSVASAIGAGLAGVLAIDYWLRRARKKAA